MKQYGFLFVLLAIGTLRAEPSLPTKEGTAWRYQSTEETGGLGYAPPKQKEVVAQIVGKEALDDTDLPKLETRSEGAVQKEELIAASEGGGVVCFARSEASGTMEKLDPPETLVPKALKIGPSWQLTVEAGGMRMEMSFAIVGEENVSVPAGSFRAFHFHAAKSGLTSAAVDRWFVPATGFVKDMSEVRGPSGSMLERVTRVLIDRPAVIALPTPTPAPVIPIATPAPNAFASPTDLSSPSPESTSRPNETKSSSAASIEVNLATPTPTVAPEKMITAEISDDPAPGSKNEFQSDAERLYVRWQGHDLPKGARIKVAWVAEDVGGIVDPNFVVDETETTASTPDASARFTLSRPTDGWAEGKYRLEVYVDGQKAATIPVQIKQAATTR